MRRVLLIGVAALVLALLPPSTAIANSGLYDITAASCPTALTCITAGHTYSYDSGGDSYDAATATTIDGGTSWRRVDVLGSSRIYDVDCPTTTTCMAVGFLDPSMDVEEGIGPRALRSIDGGRSWATQVLPFPDNINPRSNVLASVHCWNASRCIVVGSLTSWPDNFVAHSAVVATTFNGGASWTIRYPAAADWLYDVDCLPSSQTCVAVGAVESPFGAPHHGVILLSTDGGTTWRARTSTFAQYTPTTVSCTGTTCIAAPHADQDGDGPLPIYVTHDAGQSWSTQAFPWPVHSLPSIDCISGRCTIASSEGNNPLKPSALYTSTDGGTSWRPGTLPAGLGTAEIPVVACTTSLVCTAYPRFGTPLRTVDGGRSWAFTATGPT